MGSCAAPSAKGDDKFITTDYLQQCPSGSGWRKMPDGSIEQWGRISFPSEHGPVSANVSFPIPFTQTPGIVIVCDGGFGGGNMWGATNWSTTGFIAHCNYGLEGGAFFAKGW
ncbi:hypothetical protein LQT15_24370 (plasmid) [Escherichia coli]|nr:hypothetical protein LQT15_24370 [Escherichia coli]